MSTCVPTPVSTAFSTVTRNTILTTYSLSTSAVPPVVTIHVDPYCQNEAVVLNSAVCLQTGTRTSVETLQRTFPAVCGFVSFPLLSRLPGFRKVDVILLLAIPIHSLAMTALKRSSWSFSFWYDTRSRSDAILHRVSSTFHTFDRITSGLEIQRPRTLSTRSHTKLRSRSPRRFLSARSMVVAQTPILVEMAEVLVQGPATARTPVRITLAPVLALGMLRILVPMAIMEERFPSLRDTF